MDVVVALIGGGLLGALGTYIVGTRGLALKRRTDTIDTFMRVSARANGYADDGVTTIGSGQQVAAIHLVADLGSRDPWLRKSALGQLQEQHRTMTENYGPRWQATLDPEVATASAVRREIAKALELALGRLEK